MIKALRRAHFRIWVCLSVLLPAGILAAWIVVPQDVRDRLLQPESGEALPLLVKQVVGPGYLVSLRSSNDGTQLQIEWINLKPLEVSSGFLYRVDSAAKGPEGGELVGRIAERGIYRWFLRSDPMGREVHLLYYDLFHHQVITRINF